MALQKQCRHGCGLYTIQSLNTGLWRGQLVAVCAVCGEMWLYPEFALILSSEQREKKEA